MSQSSKSQDDEVAKLLIVDDDPFNQQYLTFGLSKYSNIEVVGVCSDGGEVLEFCMKNKIDVILMDIDMPKINGIVATKLVSKRFKHIKIIGHSSNTNSYYRDQMVAAGAVGYVFKSSTLNRIATVIRSLTKPDLILSLPID